MMTRLPRMWCSGGDSGLNKIRASAGKKLGLLFANKSFCRSRSEEAPADERSPEGVVEVVIFALFKD